MLFNVVIGNWDEHPKKPRSLAYTRGLEALACV